VVKKMKNVSSDQGFNGKSARGKITAVPETAEMPLGASQGQ